MFGKKKSRILVDHWLVYCVSMTSRRHGVYINREEIEKYFPEKGSPKSIKDLNFFLSQKKLEAKAINISINDLKGRDFVMPCAVPLMNGGSIILMKLCDYAQQGDLALTPEVNDIHTNNINNN